MKKHKIICNNIIKHHCTNIWKTVIYTMSNYLLIFPISLNFLSLCIIWLEFDLSWHSHLESYYFIWLEFWIVLVLQFRESYYLTWILTDLGTPIQRELEFCLVLLYHSESSQMKRLELKNDLNECVIYQYSQSITLNNQRMKTVIEWKHKPHCDPFWDFAYCWRVYDSHENNDGASQVLLQIQASNNKIIT